MRKFTINLNKENVEIIDAHFSIFSRMKMILSLIFSGYLSFYTCDNAEITYVGFTNPNNALSTEGEQ